MEADEANQQTTQTTDTTQQNTTTANQTDTTTKNDTKQQETPPNSQAENEKNDNTTQQPQDQNQTQNVNTITNMASSVDLILKYVKYYCNAVFTGSMYRYGEYMKFLHTMVPAKETTEQPAQEEQQTETQPTTDTEQNQGAVEGEQTQQA